MSVFNKRNALVGFVALKAASRALEQRRRGKGRSGLKTGLAIGLAIVSFGVLAGLAAAFLRRRGRGQEPQRLEGYAVAEAEEEPAAAEEAEPAADEPVPATT